MPYCVMREKTKYVGCTLKCIMHRAASKHVEFNQAFLEPLLDSLSSRAQRGNGCFILQ